MNPTPKSRPLSSSSTLDSLFPNRFLKPADLINWKVTTVTVTVAEIHEEEVIPKPGEPAEWKPVLYFRTKAGSLHPQGYLLSAKVDKDALKTATGAGTIGELVGKKIMIQLEDFHHKTVLRINPTPFVEEPKP